MINQEIKVQVLNEVIETIKNEIFTTLSNSYHSGNIDDTETFIVNELSEIKQSLAIIDKLEEQKEKVNINELFE